MKKISTFLFMLFVCCGVLSSKTTVSAMVSLLADVQNNDKYTNPVIPTSLPDPTVIKAPDGYFYLYATEDIRNVPIYRSTDLVHWRKFGTVFTDATRPKFVSGGGIWAPDINFINGQYVLYYSMSTWGGEWACGIGVATSRSPKGPFTDHGKLFISSEIGVQNSIDPFYIEDDGKKYLFWGSFRGIYGIELTGDGLAVKQGITPKKIAGTHTEATYIIKHDGMYYLIGSAGSCCEGARSTYHLVVARSQSLFGPYVNKQGKKAQYNFFSPLLSGNTVVKGPGHNAEFVQDDAGQYWVLYHGYAANDPGAGRMVFLDKVNWNADGWPSINNGGPSESSAKPLFGTAGIGSSTDESSDNTDVSVLPRVVSDRLRLSCSTNTTYSWRLLTVGGWMIKQGTAVGNTDIVMNGLTSGLYIVSIEKDGKKQYEKIIKR